MKKPEIILSVKSETNGKETRILRGDELFVVLYHGKPFNLTLSRKTEGHPPIYQRVAFPFKASAESLAVRLNMMFKTTDFTVAQALFDSGTV